MTYQLNVKHHVPNPLPNRMWISTWMILGAIILTTAGVALNIAVPLLSLINVFIALVLIIVLLTKSYNRQTVTFLKVDSHSIEYFCEQKERTVLILSDEITHITTRFCELHIHTRDKVHTLNMNMIRQEKKRWEIKQIIRELATEHKLSAAS